MTRADAFKSLCPYNMNRHCAADLCPKWRWEPLETCKTLNGDPLDWEHCAYTKMTEQQHSEHKVKPTRIDSRNYCLSFCTGKCTQRHGYCG